MTHQGLSPRPDDRMNPRHPNGPVAQCIHCYQTLGRAENPERKSKILSAHTCSERLLAKKPASPPPYN